MTHSAFYINLGGLNPIILLTMGYIGYRFYIILNNLIDLEDTIKKRQTEYHFKIFVKKFLSTRYANWKLFPVGHIVGYNPKNKNMLIG